MLKKRNEARLCAFCIDSFELRTRANTLRLRNKTSRKVQATLYNGHYVKLTLSYPQKKE
jgi:hypothetical protein